MSPDQPLSPIEALHEQLRRALDDQLATLSGQYDAALEAARQEAAGQVRQEMSAELEIARQEFERRLATESAARTEAERRVVAETTRIRMEAEQQAAESAARVREELEGALAAERQHAEQRLEDERRNAAAALQREQARAEREIADAKRSADEAAERAQAAAAADAALVAERHARIAGFERLLEAMTTLDRAGSLTEALGALLTHTTSVTARAAIFLVNGSRLRSWRTVGFPQLDAQPFDASIIGPGLLAQAVQAGVPVASGPGVAAPTFAAVPADRAGLAVPIVVGGRAVAVLYADNVGPDGQARTSWPEFVEILARHASAVLALLTAMRTLQAVGAPAAAQPVATSGVTADEQGARRYARLLVSEIKLYNEAAVRQGREKRDLLARLRSEIDRARRLYEERVPPVLGARAQYFQQELVQTLADGDPALLGNA